MGNSAILIAQPARECVLRIISDRVSQTPRSLTYLSQNVVFCFRLEEVDLRHNQLESVCSELFQIESLKHLDLSHICLKMLFSVLG